MKTIRVATDPQIYQALAKAALEQTNQPVDLGYTQEELDSVALPYISKDDPMHSEMAKEVLDAKKNDPGLYNRMVGFE